MAIVEVKVPQLSESVAEATLQQWRKHPHQEVEQDETLIEIETDKVMLEVPAPAAGVLIQILKQNGETVLANEVIAKIDTERKQTNAVEAKPSKEAGQTGQLAPGAQSERVPVPTATEAQQRESQISKIRAMPSAAKLMDEQHISAVQGTGRDGRITKADVLSSTSTRGAEAETIPAAIPTIAPRTAKLAPAEVKTSTEAALWLEGRPEQRVPMSRLRLRVAERLSESQQTNVILTTFNEVNMRSVIDLRSKYRVQFEKEYGVRLGFMSFIVKAAVHALKKYPIINASIDGNEIIYHGYFDIGVAVGSPRGLVVPILRNADQLSVASIEKKIAEFGQKAQDGKLLIDELTGGTFSISNGGVFGSMLSTPIINPPQSAILGVHATKDRAVVENGQIVVRPITYLALSYDHRLIDGREAVLSLVAIKEALEDPTRLLLDL